MKRFASSKGGKRTGKAWAHHGAQNGKRREPPFGSAGAGARRGNGSDHQGNPRIWASSGKIVSVEFARHFYDDLLVRYPGVDFRHGDAFDLHTTLGDRRDDLFDCVISAVPLLSFSVEKRVALIEDLLSRLPAGRPVIQITYGPLSPVCAMPERYTISHFDFVLRNIPPAQLWIYKRPG
jgi:hypothetical protein